MKKIAIAVGLMLGALSFTGCRYDVVAPAKTGNDEVKTQTLTIMSSGAEAVNEDGTRTEMNGDKTAGFNTSWVQATDKLGVYTVHTDVSDMATRNVEFSIASLEDGIATFEGEVYYDSVDRTYDLYAYYPYDGGAFNQFMTYDRVQASISNEQTMPANDTHDPASDYMIAFPQQLEVVGGKLLNASIDNFRFRYMVGFMNLTVKAITATGIAAGDVVESVKITATGTTPAVTGNYLVNLESGDASPVSDKQYGDVTVNLPAGTTLGELSAWAVVAPFEAEQLTFLITTATHTIAKTATTEQLRGGFSIAAGGIKTFNMTIDDACTITEIGGNETKTLFSETFDDCSGTQAPNSGTIYDGTQYSNTAPARLKTEGWVFNASGLSNGLGCIRVGWAMTNSRYIVTPALTAIGSEPVDVILTFKAYNWEDDTQPISLVVTTTEGGGVVSEGNIELPARVPDGTLIPEGEGIESRSYQVAISGATGATKIRIESPFSAVSNGRFILDDVLVVTDME